jgi:Trk K+ transport system NAD-binding subunit
MPFEIVIIGGGSVGRSLATRLTERGDAVRVVDPDEQTVAQFDDTAVRAIRGDGSDLETLQALGLDHADIALIVTGDDDTNLLATQLIRANFDVDPVIARVNTPSNQDAFESLGIITVTTTEATARLLDDHIAHPSFAQWLEELGSTGDAREVGVMNPDVDGLTIRDLNNRLPEQSLIATWGDDHAVQFPTPTEVVDVGDHVTVLGERTAVADAVAYLTDQQIREPPVPESEP